MSEFDPIIIRTLNLGAAWSTFNATVTSETTLNKAGAAGVRITKSNGLNGVGGARCNAGFTAFTLQPNDEIHVRVRVPDNQVVSNLQVFLCRLGANEQAEDSNVASWNLGSGQPLPAGDFEFILTLRPHTLFDHAANGVPNVTGLGFFMYQDQPAGDSIIISRAVVARRTSAQKAIVVHTSDDGFRGHQLKNMLDVLDAYLIPTACGIITDAVGSGDDTTGFMTEAQIREMRARNHFPTNHSRNLHDAGAMNGKPHPIRMAFIEGGRQWLVDRGLGEAAAIFYAPLGMGNGVEWTDGEVEDLRRLATVVVDTSQKGWPAIPRACGRVRCVDGSATGAFQRGDVLHEYTSGGQPTGAVGTFSHFGFASGGNVQLYMRFERTQTGLPTQGSGAKWINQTAPRAGNEVTTNNTHESHQFGTGKTCRPVDNGTSIAGWTGTYMQAVWRRDWIPRTLADFTGVVKDDFNVPGDGVWDNTAKTITKTGIGTGITGQTGLVMCYATGMQPGWYSVSNITANAITLSVDPHTGVAPNFPGNPADVTVLTFVSGSTGMRAISRGSLYLGAARNSIMFILTHRVLFAAQGYDGTHAKIADFLPQMAYLRSLADAGLVKIMSLPEAVMAMGVNPAAESRRPGERTVQRLDRF